MWRQVNRQVELLLLINVVCANVVHGAPRRRSQGSPHDGADTTHVVRGTEPSGCTTAHAHRRQLQTWSRTHFEAGGEHETKRIAFLFLHPVIHEELWGRFLDGYDTRYSLYVHTEPDFTLKSTLFAGREVPSDDKAVWGTMGMLQVELALLKAAFHVLDNAHFVLLSETSIPLRPFQEVYAALMGSELSVVDACSPAAAPVTWKSQGAWALDDAPLDSLMERLWVTWRRSAQWFVLTRRHALAVLRDKQVLTAFKKHCRRAAWAANRTEECFADESYIPTLLAYKGMADETSCIRGPIAFREASTLEHPMHPLHREARIFTPLDISARIMYQLRGGRCPVSCRTRRGNCNLFALQFPKAVEKPLLRMSDLLYGGATLSGEPIPCA